MLSIISLILTINIHNGGKNSKLDVSTGQQINSC